MRDILAAALPLALLVSCATSRELLGQGQLVPIVPAANNPAVLDLRDRDARHSNALVRRGYPKMIACVSHYGGPANHDPVTGSEDIFDGDLYIRKRAVETIE